MDKDDGPFSHASRENELWKAKLETTAPMDPPAAYACGRSPGEYFSDIEHVVERVLAFDERAATYWRRRAEITGEFPESNLFSITAATRLWEVVSQCVEEVDYILRCDDTRDDIAIMMAKAKAIHDYSHKIHTAYREREAAFELEMHAIKMGGGKGDTANSQPTTPKKGRSRTRGRKKTNADVLLIGFFGKHHAYGTAALHCEPAKGAAVALMLKVSEATVSRFLDRYFGGSDAYRRLCELGPEALAKRLKSINDEYFRGHSVNCDIPE